MVIIYFSALQCKVQCKFTYFIKHRGMLIVLKNVICSLHPIKIPSRVTSSLRIADVFERLPEIRLQFAG